METESAGQSSRASTITRHLNGSPTATLACGAVSEYEAPDLVPAAGDVVPCRRHGHCPVAFACPTGRGALGRPVLARPPRSQADLMAHLQRRGTMTLRALRRERFSLRFIALAEKEGLVHVDLLAGVVTARAAARLRPARETESRSAA